MTIRDSRRTGRRLPPLFALVAILGAASLAAAYSGGPPNALTNAPGEGNCTACHGTYPLNSGGGSLTVEGLASAFVPGDTYTVTVRLADPAASRWGFELTVLDEAGNSAGALMPGGAETQVSTGGAFGRTYVKQTATGAYTGTTGEVTWTFQWTAPDAPAGPVTFYFTGNAANGNGSTGGDRIYATSTSLGPVSATGVIPGRALAELRAPYPNPFNPSTRLAFRLADAGRVRLEIVDATGRLVARLLDTDLAAGDHAVRWNGRDTAGRPAPSGLYLARLQTRDGIAVQKLSLMK